MKTELTREDLENISKLIQRVKDITGAEALAVAQLQIKLNTMAKELEPKETHPVDALLQTPPQSPSKEDKKK